MLRYLLVCFAFVAASLAHEPFQEQLQWKYFNYTWPSSEAYTKAKSDGSYIEKNNIQGGIKVWKDKLYLAIPRFKGGIPVTLAVTSATALNKTYSPLLEPYPSWDAQKIGDCSVLQNVHNMEIDPKGRMWVVDTGRIATLIEPQNICPPKLVILDLENGGKVLKSYEFPDYAVDRSTAELLDIAIDHEHGGVAYVVDSDEIEPSIVVYSLANNTSWKVHHSSMNGVCDAVGFKADGVKMNLKIDLHGITLSPASTEAGKREVYYNPLSSFSIFAIPTRTLIEAQHKKRLKREQFVDKHVKNLGQKPSQTEGIAMTNSGKLYYGLLSLDSVGMWDSSGGDDTFVAGQRIITRDHFMMQSPGNFALDDEGRLWCFSNRMNRYVNDVLDINKFNYRALMSNVNERSYQYYADGKAPELPKIGEHEDAVPRLG